MKTQPENRSSQESVLSKHLNAMHVTRQSYFSGKLHNIYTSFLPPLKQKEETSVVDGFEV